MVLPVNAQKSWQSSVLPAVIVPAAISDLEILKGVEWTRWGLLDRASYEFAEAPAIPEILEALVGIASEITGRSLHRRSHRALRLAPGDYILSSHDRIHEDRPVELTLDLSEAEVPDAEIHYRHRGQVYFAVRSAPGSLAIVERGPTVTSNHTYVSLRNKGSVVRLSVLLGTNA